MQQAVPGLLHQDGTETVGSFCLLNLMQLSWCFKGEIVNFKFSSLSGILVDRRLCTTPTRRVCRSLSEWHYCSDTATCARHPRFALCPDQLDALDSGLFSEFFLNPLASFSRPLSIVFSNLLAVILHCALVPLWCSKSNQFRSLTPKCLLLVSY